jgi:(p)ppGpp synthase/HD superfamily hydrolase
MDLYAALDMYSVSKSKRISQAVRFAAAAHSGQYRKGTKTPYVWHPLSVGRLLDKAGCSTETIVAGILHDVVEDTSITLEQVKQRFGVEVAEILEACSVSDTTMPWEIRRKRVIEKLRTAPIEAKIVSAADKLDNLRDTAADLAVEGERVWERFNRGRQRQEWYYRNVLLSLTEGSGQAADHPLVRALELEIDRVFGEPPGVVAGCGSEPEDIGGGAGGQNE